MKHKSNKAGFKLEIELPVDQKKLVEREAKRHGSAGNFITLLIDRRNGPASFKEWLDAMPPVEGGKDLRTCSLEVTMTVTNWLVLREAAVNQATTIESMASQILSGSDDLMELSHTQKGEEL